MKRNYRLVLSAIIVAVVSIIFAYRDVDGQGIAAPILKWQHGGCYSSWCETGWYSSPAVADLDGDGTAEVIGSPYSLFVLNGENGTEQWSADPPGSRTWPGIVVADLDNDGDPEVVTAHGGGYVNVYDHAGGLVWSRQPAGSELRGLSVYDLDGDGTLEVLVTAAVGSKTNSWVLEHDGSTRAGWPQLSNESGYAWGVFNDNAAVGELDGDPTGEIVIPSDVHYINAYDADGTQLPAHAMYGGDKGWGKVGIWESLDVELRGWGRCNGERAESYRTNFADGPAVIADVDGNGTVEVIATGNVYDCHAGYPPSRYMGVYIFNADRSRFNAGGYDWRTVPVDTGAPLSEDYSVIESVMPNPVVVDLDGDSEREILYASYDGRLHAFWLDKTEHYNWPYDVNATGAGIRFASEPVVADLNDDGTAEVLFASWPQKGGNRVGKFHILDYQGTVLHEIDLPAPYGGAEWNGALPAPTLDNIDADADLELVLNTAHSGLVAYDLPGTSSARVLWGTGRGNYQRTGSFLTGTLDDSSMSVAPIVPAPGESLTYRIRLVNPGLDLTTVSVMNSLPAEITYAGNLSATSGTVNYASGEVTWSGAVPAGEPVEIRYDATVNAGITVPTPIKNVALLDDGLGNQTTVSAMAIANATGIYVPAIHLNP